MTPLIKTLSVIVGSLLTFSVMAFEIGAEFSAEAVQNVPGRTPVIAKMFVSKQAVRTESTINGNTIVEIVYLLSRQRILLNQLSKTYFEQSPAVKNKHTKPKQNNSPCDKLIQASCRQLGSEKIDGRDSIKWEMTILDKGRQSKSLHWFDKQHHIPLKQQFSDGTISTMSYLGSDKIQGRTTDKWKFQSIRKSEKPAESLQWYDTELKMVIREELPGGYSRELRNIKVAKQNKKLFKIPSDYKKEAAHQ